MQDSSHSVAATPSRWSSVWGPLLVCLAGSLLAGHLLYQFWDRADQLWYSWEHDRNAHYLQGLTLGLGARSLDVVSIFRELERMQTWGVLHPVLEGIVQFVAGPDHRLAVLPSLLAWVGCAVFGFLLTRRMVPRFGNLAGFVTATFILASPGHHAYATDIMLESLGACLSLAVLYLYLVYVQEDTRRSGIWLGAIWALLFYCKANYWLLVTIPLVLSETYRHRTAIMGFLRQERPEIVPTLRRQLRHPLTWLIAVPALVGLYVLKIAPIAISLGSFSATIQSYQSLMHFAFACLSLRTWLWWRSGGREWLATWPATQRVVVLTASLPIAFWFLLPKRLGRFLWFVTSTHSLPVEKLVPFPGFNFYWQGFLDDYLTAPWLIWLILALSVLAFARFGKLLRGTGAVLLFLVLATTLTLHHPMLKYRLMHSWVAIYWVTAGAGFALLLAGLARIHEHLARGAGVAAAGALAIYMGPAFMSAGHAQEAGVRPDRRSFLEVTDTFQPHLDPRQKVQILCSDTEAFGLKWTAMEKIKRPRLVGLDIPGFNQHAQDPQTIRQWLRTTKVDSLVLVETAKDCRFGGGYAPVSLQVIEEVLREHDGFQCARQWDLAEGEKVSLWTRTSVAAASEK